MKMISQYWEDIINSPNKNEDLIHIPPKNGRYIIVFDIETTCFWNRLYNRIICSWNIRW